jgi:hypothetical protein
VAAAAGEEETGTKMTAAMAAADTAMVWLPIQLFLTLGCSLVCWLAGWLLLRVDDPRHRLTLAAGGDAYGGGYNYGAEGGGGGGGRGGPPQAREGDWACPDPGYLNPVPPLAFSVSCVFLLHTRCVDCADAAT